jgi:transcription initiation factor TFIIIB Brf1 subunit/transcription initiation factor TFIIB
MLDRRSRALLDFERDWRIHEGRKEQAVRERFGISAARYYQLLNRVIDQRESDAYDPLTVRRLRQRRTVRQRRRTARALGEPQGS